MGGVGGQTVPVPRLRMPELRSPLARAVVPVVGGIAFFAVLGGILWLVAMFIGRNPDDVQLGANRFEVGRIDRLADSIAKTGPQLFQDLKSSDARRSVVVDHVGSVDVTGWSVYRPFPADVPGEECFAVQTPLTRQFTDCQGRVLDVTQLQPAADVFVDIRDGRTVVLTFSGAVLSPTSTAATTTS